MKVFVSSQTPLLKNPSLAERWRDIEHGLITCYETGKIRRQKRSRLAGKAARGELPMLEWKGGVVEKLALDKNTARYFTWHNFKDCAGKI